MFPVLFHCKRRERIIPCLPSAWHSGMLCGFLPPFSPPEEKLCFILPVTPAHFPFYQTPFSPHSATAPVRCSAALCAFLSPGKPSLGDSILISRVFPEDAHWPRMTCLLFLLDCCFLLHWQGNSWAEILTSVRPQCQQEGSVLVSCALANTHFAWVAFHAALRLFHGVCVLDLRPSLKNITVLVPSLLTTTATKLPALLTAVQRKLP